jgi:dTDP-4-dehydrorhamnose reductase
MKKALLFGSGGQLGVELKRVLAARGYLVTALTRADLDIASGAQVERKVAEVDPSLVVNSAAYNMVDVAEQEPQAAFLVNGLAVRHMAVACRQLDVPLVHFSTDYVFDGAAGRPYTEDDAVHPLGAYGVSKLAGELYARAYLDRPLIIRTSGVFGPAGRRTPRGNFPELMLRLAAGNQPIRVVEDHFASPTYAPALAERTADLIAKGAHGIYHVGGGQAVSWFEYAQRIFQAANLNPRLQPTTEREYRTAARRPRFSALSNAKMEAAGVAPMPSLDEALADLLARRAEYVA